MPEDGARYHRKRARVEISALEYVVDATDAPAT
jgi:hypothetical protein